MTDWRETFQGVRAVWNGEANVDDLDRLLAPNYRGHLGSRDRDLTQLKNDIVAYRATAPNIEFRLEHQFGEGDYVATRWTASPQCRTTSRGEHLRNQHQPLGERLARRRVGRLGKLQRWELTRSGVIADTRPVEN